MPYAVQCHRLAPVTRAWLQAATNARVSVRLSAPALPPITWIATCGPSVARRNAMLPIV